MRMHIPPPPLSLFICLWLPCCHETRIYTCSCMLLILIKASHSREQWSFNTLFDTATVNNIVRSKIDSWPWNSLYEPTIRKRGSVCNVGSWLIWLCWVSRRLCQLIKASLRPHQTFQTIVIPLTFQWQRWKNTQTFILWSHTELVRRSRILRNKSVIRRPRNDYVYQ